MQQLDPGQGKTKRAYLWAYRSNDLEGAPRPAAAASMPATSLTGGAVGPLHLESQHPLPAACSLHELIGFPFLPDGFLHPAAGSIYDIV